MKIYTRTGDAGTTGLFGGGRVEKDAPQVEAYGSVDELNACIGLARAELSPDTPIHGWLGDVQGDLLTLGAELACAPNKQDRLGLRLLGAEDATRLERCIDEAESALEPLRTFVLPGGSRAAACLHLARTVCRRAERRVLHAGKSGNIRAELLIYLNRLSDFLFVLARRVNHDAGFSETPWKPNS
jgi:cob(I)alamin adenosyltransferase